MTDKSEIPCFYKDNSTLNRTSFVINLKLAQNLGYKEKVSFFNRIYVIDFNLKKSCLTLAIHYS